MLILAVVLHFLHILLSNTHLQQAHVQTLVSTCTDLLQCIKFIKPICQLFTPSGGRPTLSDLVAIDGLKVGRLRPMEIISSHSMAQCERFAQVMLNDDLAVTKLKRDSDEKPDVFIDKVLRKWVSSGKSEPAVGCTWENLLECMDKASMDGLSIENIRKALLQPSTGKVYKMIRCYIKTLV